MKGHSVNTGRDIVPARVHTARSGPCDIITPEN